MLFTMRKYELLITFYQSHCTMHNMVANKMSKYNRSKVSLLESNSVTLSTGTNLSWISQSG